MGKVFIVRHGETDCNRGISRWIGWSDPPLNQEGRSQAQSVGRRLEAKSLAAVYSSDLTRAMETATCVAARHGIEIRTRQELREVNYGDWEGRTEEECRMRDPDIFFRRLADPDTVAPPNGENYHALLRRFLPEMQRIAREHANEAVAVVTHHGNIRLLLCRLFGLPLKRYRVFNHANGAVTVLNVRGDRWVVETINDTCHLSACGVALQAGKT